MKKLADSVEQMEQAVAGGYKKMENSVVSGYKKMEHGIVAGFEKVCDRCVEALFTKEGETVEEARERLSAKKNSQRLS